MKRKNELKKIDHRIIKAASITRYIVAGLASAAVILILVMSFQATAESEAYIRQAEMQTESMKRARENATGAAHEYERLCDNYSDTDSIALVTLSSSGNDVRLDGGQEVTETATKVEETAAEDLVTPEETEAAQETEPDINSMDVWALGSYLYGISELDTTRTLKLITYEGYGDSMLSYYVACCCWVRATEGYWGYDNLYRAFGEADASYDLWMDDIEIADWAYDYLWWCYMEPSYVRYCNGMVVPDGWAYEENGIYVW